MLMDLYGLAEGKGRRGNPAPVLINIRVPSIRFFHQRFLQPNEQSDLHESLGWLPSNRSDSPRCPPGHPKSL